MAVYSNTATSLQSVLTVKRTLSIASTTDLRLAASVVAAIEGLRLLMQINKAYAL